MDEFDQMKSLFTKSLKKMEESKFITINSMVAIEGLAATLVNDIRAEEAKVKESREINAMLDTMQRYYPDKFSEFIKSISIEK